VRQGPFVRCVKARWSGAAGHDRLVLRPVASALVGVSPGRRRAGATPHAWKPAASRASAALLQMGPIKRSIDIDERQAVPVARFRMSATP